METRSGMGYPLLWPARKPRTKHPEISNFKKITVHQGCLGVRKELERNGASQIVISTNIEVRLDGLPYSNRRNPEDAGVAVYFRIDGEPFELACDRWYRVGCNLRAIAKHSESLRGQDRWGVVSGAEAFRGHAALPEHASQSSWRSLLNFDLDDMPNVGEVQARFRELALERHPDRGGSSALIQATQQARDDALAELRQ